MIDRFAKKCPKKEATSIVKLGSALVLFIMVLLPGSRVFAQGGPPLLTDDPGTPGDGQWEVNVAVTVEQGRTARWWEAPLLDINYGLGERIQLKFEIPWLILDEDDRPVESGLGNSAFGIKWRFLDEDRHGVAMSVYPQFEFNNPTSSADRGIVDPGTEILLPFEVERSWGNFGINAELGYAFRQDSEDEWVYGVALGYEFSERFELMGEVHGIALHDFQDNHLLLNLGARRHVNDRISILGSAGRSIDGPIDDEVQFLGYFGIQLRF